MDRTVWTDERLNDSFQALRADIAELRGDNRELRAEMRELRAAIDERFERQNHILLGGAVGIIAALIGAIAAFLASNAL